MQVLVMENIPFPSRMTHRAAVVVLEFIGEVVLVMVISGNGSSSSGVSSKVAYKAQNMYLDSGATCYNVSIFGLMYAVDYNNTTVTGVRALSGTERMDNEQNRVNMARGQVEDLLLFVSTFNKSTIEKYGQQYKATLEGLKVNIKGKKLKTISRQWPYLKKSEVIPSLP
ncbi:hypothetical protein [Serratia fonticola]|uniref:hypothetical protein n=1 Tax=Serratia fonticola TaxID=47917 RepID=UPI0021B76063|nr:hypothetical protein [Serratia fonticola]